MNKSASGRYLKAFNKGEDRLAVDFFRQHLIKNPDDLLAIGVLASALLRQERFSEAIPWFDKILKVQPDNQSMQLGRISCWLAVGNADIAIECLKGLLVCSSNQPALWDALGQAYVKAGQYPEGYKAFCQALALPDCPESAYIHLLELFLGCELFDADISPLAKWAENSETHPAWRLNYGTVLYRRTQFIDAHDIWRGLLADLPQCTDVPDSTYAQLYANLAGVCIELSRAEEALVYCKQAEQYGYAMEQILGYRAQLCRTQGQYLEALDYTQKAILHAPDFDNMYSLQGQLLLACGDVDESWRAHQQALALTPDNRQFQFLAALTSFVIKDDLREAWALYEGRWFNPRTGCKSVLPWPEWQGGRQQGSLLLYREQGLGDEVFWASMFYEVSQYFDAVLCICHPKLQTLFTRSFPNIVFVADRSSSHPLVFEKFSSQLPIGSLGAVLRPHRSCFDQTVESFLIADPVRTEHWQQRLSVLGTGLKVGLAWRSVDLVGGRGIHYPPLAELRPLLQVLGVEFINLQYCATPTECAEIESMLGRTFYNFRQVDHFDDLDASAALMAACDVVVAPCTATAALAAALGVPVLEMAAVAVDGFQLGQQQSPWVPMLTRFGKQPDAPWSTVIEQIAHVLQQLQLERCLGMNTEFC